MTKVPVILKFFLAQGKVFALETGYRLGKYYINKIDLTICRSVMEHKFQFLSRQTDVRHVYQDTVLALNVAHGCKPRHTVVQCGCYSQGCWGFYFLLCFDLFNHCLWVFLMLSWGSFHVFACQIYFHSSFLSGTVKCVSFVCVLWWIPLVTFIVLNHKPTLPNA